MSYRLEPVFPTPDGYFPDFYDKIFSGDVGIQEVYPGIGFNQNWDEFIAAKSDFPPETRLILSSVLTKQYAQINSLKAQENIQLLKESNTFTVTTGQQIHIFLGPLYVIYKALSTIHLAGLLKEKYPEKNFIPMFWMATEDHDKAEIDHVTFQGKKVIWETSQTGAVGRFNTDGLTSVVQQMKDLATGNTDISGGLAIFEEAYAKFHNFADATRYLLDHFFGKYGLIAIDADDKELKSQFKSTMRIDLFENQILPAINEKSLALKNIGIDPAIPAKNGNFFLLDNDGRHRIDRIGEAFKIQNKETEITSAELETIIENNPEKLSPNVALRPIYQETILPNLAYIAGPGEIRYWMQLNKVFSACNVTPPALVPRHSVVFTNPKFETWHAKSNLNIKELWKDEKHIKNMLLKSLAERESLNTEVSQLKDILELINKKLFVQHNKQLKEIKKAGELFLKEVKNAENNFIHGIFEMPENVSRLEKAMKFHNTLFNPIQPQERVVDFIQVMDQNKDFLAQVFQLPKIDLTNLYLARYE